MALRSHRILIVNDDEADGTLGRLLPTEREQERRADRGPIHVVVVERLDAEGALQLMEALELARAIRATEELQPDRHTGTVPGLT